MIVTGSIELSSSIYQNSILLYKEFVVLFFLVRYEVILIGELMFILPTQIFQKTLSS